MKENNALEAISDDDLQKRMKEFSLNNPEPLNSSAVVLSLEGLTLDPIKKQRELEEVGAITSNSLNNLDPSPSPSLFSFQPPALGSLPQVLHLFPSKRGRESEEGDTNPDAVEARARKKN